MQEHNAIVQSEPGNELRCPRVRVVEFLDRIHAPGSRFNTQAGQERICSGTEIEDHFIAYMTADSSAVYAIALFVMRHRVVHYRTMQEGCANGPPQLRPA